MIKETDSSSLHSTTDNSSKDGASAEQVGKKGEGMLQLAVSITYGYVQYICYRFSCWSY